MLKMKGKFLFNENRGTSIVELLVIMAVLAVLVGISTNLTAYLSGKQARQCAYKIEAAISEIRMETMSKSTGEKESVYLILENNGNLIYSKQMIKGKEHSDLVGEKVTLRVGDGRGTFQEVTSGEQIPIYFNRATGALLKESEPYAAFEIQQGRVIYSVTIEPVTGRVNCERK